MYPTYVLILSYQSSSISPTPKTPNFPAYRTHIPERPSWPLAKIPRPRIPPLRSIAPILLPLVFFASLLFLGAYLPSEGGHGVGHWHSSHEHVAVHYPNSNSNPHSQGHLPVVEKIDIIPSTSTASNKTAGNDSGRMSALKHLKIAPKEAHKSTIIFLHVSAVSVRKR